MNVDQYLRTALSPDILPIALGRSYSALGRLWLKDYVVLREQKLREDEIAKIKRGVNQNESEDNALADVDPFMRTVRLDLSDIEELVMVDDKADDPSRTKKELVNILRDSIGFAHELGGVHYPRAHGAVFLDPRTGSPMCIDDQRELNELALLVAMEGGTASTWRYVGAAYNNVVRQYLNNEWFYEMLALLSQKRRLEEHMSVGWHPETKAEVRRWCENLESLDSGTSVYELGLEVWRKLKEKFQSRANSVVDLAVNNIFEPSIRGGLTIELNRQQIPAIAAMLNPAHVLLGALECDTSTVSTEQLKAKLTSCAEFGEVSAVGRFQCLVKTHLQAVKNHEKHEAPALSALCVGRLWIALNSIVSAVWLCRDRGSTQILIKKRCKDFLDNDPEALKLALSLMSLRRAIINRIRVKINVTEYETRKKGLVDYIAGNIPLEKFIALDRPVYTTYVYPTDDFEDYDYLPQAVERYYSSHTHEIERWIDEPSDHLEKALSVM